MNGTEDQMRSAREIQEVLDMPGWAHISAMIDEQAQEPKDELWEIMAKKPDTLTGKTALKYAMRAKALIEFKESVYDRIKILAPTRNRAGNE